VGCRFWRQSGKFNNIVSKYSNNLHASEVGTLFLYDCISHSSHILILIKILTNTCTSYKKSNNMQQAIKIYFIFIQSSTCFGRHTANHQECSAPSHTLPDSVQQLHVQQPSTHAKPEAASAVLGS